VHASSQIPSRWPRIRSTAARRTRTLLPLLPDFTSQDDVFRCICSGVCYDDYCLGVPAPTWGPFRREDTYEEAHSCCYCGLLCVGRIRQIVNGVSKPATSRVGARLRLRAARFLALARAAPILAPTWPFWCVSGIRDYIYQTVATSNGTQYTLSLWAQNLSASGGDVLTVTWNSAVLYNQAAPTGWNLLSFNVVGTGSDTVEIGSFDGPDYHLVDDVSLDIVPEPASLVALGIGALALIRRRRA